MGQQSVGKDTKSLTGIPGKCSQAPHSWSARRDLTPHRHGRHIAVARQCTSHAGRCVGTGAAGAPAPQSATRVHNAKIPAKNGGDFSDVRPEGFEPPAY